MTSQYENYKPIIPIMQELNQVMKEKIEKQM